jgi:uncharacterized protein RhaS with RHS repeats
MHNRDEIGKILADRESDMETSLYYYRARYYDPATLILFAPRLQAGDHFNLYNRILRETQHRHYLSV